MKEIDFEERKRIQLQILTEVDCFCRNNGIRYFIAYGTLIGAIRHKGFIPWDDDIDICMPLEDMLKFKQIFKSKNLKYCDIDTEDGYGFTFSRVADKSTYNKRGLCSKLYGVNIDIYPLIEVPSTNSVVNDLLKQAKKLLNRRLNYIRLRNVLATVLPIKSIPGFQKAISNYRDFWFKVFPLKGGGAFHCIAGPLSRYNKNTFPFNPFEKLIEVEFENKKFFAPARYHEYLTHIFGDYMTLPPEDQRHPYHIGHYYWK